MNSGNIAHFFWPDLGNTVSIAALVVTLAVFVFGAFSGVRANKVRILFSLSLSTLLGWLVMPLAVYAASAVHMTDSRSGVVVLITLMMLLVAALATSIYEIVTVSISDVGLASKQ